MGAVEHLFYDVFEQAKGKAHRKGSFGFFHSNINFIRGEMSSLFIRVNPGLNPQDVDTILDFINFLLQYMKGPLEVSVCKKSDGEYLTWPSSSISQLNNYQIVKTSEDCTSLHVILPTESLEWKVPFGEDPSSYGIILDHEIEYGGELRSYWSPLSKLSEKKVTIE